MQSYKDAGVKPMKGSKTFLAAVIALYLLVYLINDNLAIISFSYFWASLAKLLPFFALMLIVLWLFNYFVKPQKIARLVGKHSGIKGWVIAISAGIVSMGPMSIWYPLLADLNRQGLRPALSAAFLYARAIKIPLLPVMAYYFGVVYTLLFVVSLFLFSIASGMLLEALVADPNSEQ